MYPIPILFLIYKRKNLALNTFSQIAKQKPKKLYIFSDFNDNKQIQKKIIETRRAVLEKINWKCEVKTYFSKNNIGFKYFKKEALNWVLNKNNEDYVVYIEDDIFCSDGFFKFQKELLPLYYNDERILGITGYNFGFKPKINNSYFLSRFVCSWGVGFYKRILKFYDLEVKDYLWVKKQNWYKKRFIEFKSYYYHDIYLTKIAKQEDFWGDPQLQYAAYKYNKFYIVTAKKLVENLGFNLEGHNPFIFTYKSPIEKIEKINHPPKLSYSRKIEVEYYRRILTGGLLRLFLIRVYFNLPKFLKKVANFLVKLVIKAITS